MYVMHFVYFLCFSFLSVLVCVPTLPALLCCDAVCFTSLCRAMLCLAELCLAVLYMLCLVVLCVVVCVGVVVLFVLCVQGPCCSMDEFTLGYDVMGKAVSNSAPRLAMACPC